MVLGKKVATFNWEWSRNSAPRDGQKIPCRQFPNISRLFLQFRSSVELRNTNDQKVARPLIVQSQGVKLYGKSLYLSIHIYTGFSQ